MFVVTSVTLSKKRDKKERACQSHVCVPKRIAFAFHLHSQLIVCVHASDVYLMTFTEAVSFTYQRIFLRLEICLVLSCLPVQYLDYLKSLIQFNKNSNTYNGLDG